MTKAAASLTAIAIFGLGVVGQLSAAKAQPYGYPPERVQWTVAPGYFGFSGFPWPGPPFYSPDSPADVRLLLHPRATSERVARGRSLLLKLTGERGA